MKSIRFAYGDVEVLYMPLVNIDELFGPFTDDGESLKDHRFSSSDSGAEDFVFDGDVDDWRLVLLEISLQQRLMVMENKLSIQLDTIHSHVKYLRCTLESLIDPQRGAVSDDS